MYRQDALLFRGVDEAGVVGGYACSAAPKLVAIMLHGMVLCRSVVAVCCASLGQVSLEVVLPLPLALEVSATPT